MFYSNDWVAEEVKYKTMAFCFYIAPRFHAKDNLDSYLRIFPGQTFSAPIVATPREVAPDHQSHGAESNNDFKWTKQVMK